jgi:hypothetical protein
MVSSSEKDDKFKDIDKRVDLYIEGGHGRIGIIVPYEKPTAEEWRIFNETISEIIYNPYNIKENNEAT